jgi:DNA-binding PadR family transcriptional regulator
LSRQLHLALLVSGFGPVPGNADFGRSVSVCPPPSPDIVAALSTATISAPLSGSPRCNTVGVPAGGESAARSLSADNAASAVGVRNAYAATSGLQSAYLFFIVEHMSREVLGNFELMVMLALIRLGDAAYGVPISKIIEESTNREVLVGSVYAALERLEAKGFVLSEVGEPTPERGGRAKRYFRITDNGLRQVRDTRGALVKLWKGIPALQGGTQ